jgi:succinyl-diaminopimelate desuccinylase
MIERSEAIRLLSDLVRIPSVNPHISGGAGEGGLARFLTAHLRGLGLAPLVIEVAPGRPNVLATAPGKPGGRHLLFEAHMDTVSPSHGQVEPFVPRLEGSRLYGRGACDTKGSMAAMLMALATVIPSANRAATVSVAFTMGEELGHEGARHLAASGFRADGAIVGEPTGLDVVVAHKGVARWRMTTVGRSAHSANPEVGINAIGMMARLIRALDERLVPELTQRRHPLLGPPTLSIGRIAGGTEVNVVPDRCTIEVDRRMLPGETWGSVKGELERLLAGLDGEGASLQVTIEEPYQETEGMEVAAESWIVRTAEEAVRRIDGRHPVRGVPYCTDASSIAAAGIPCMVLGPGHIEQAHTSAEYVEIQQVVKAAAIYRELMLGV